MFTAKYKPLANRRAKKLIGIFGNVRNDTLAQYMKRVENVSSPDRVIKDIVYNTQAVERTMPYPYVAKSPNYEPDNSGFNCADVFIALMDRLNEYDDNPEEFWARKYGCSVSKAEFPYDYVMSHKNTIYILMDFDRKGMHKIQRHNLSKLPEKKTGGEEYDDVNFVFVVIKDSTKQDVDLSEIEIKGEHLIAQIRRDNGQTYCEFER